MQTSVRVLTALCFFVSFLCFTASGAIAASPEASLPEAPEASQINPCDGFSIQDLAGQINNQKHDGQRFYFNPDRLQWDPNREIWYDNQGASTWECQINSNATGDADLVHDFFYRRSGASAGDMQGRLTFGDGFMDELGEQHNTCFICGLVRHRKGCFPPGVRVTLADGTSTKAVEEVAAGDELWNPVRKAAVKVLKVIEGPEEKALLRFTAGELSLTVSDEHPMHTKEGFKKAKEVSTDDFFFDAQGKAHQVTAIESLPVKDGQTVINFELEDDGKENARLLLADGVVVGDLVLQQELAAK